MRRAWLPCALLALLLCPGPLGSTAQAEEEAETEAEPSSGWRLRVSGGPGATASSIDLPMDGAVYETRTGLAPAFDVGFELDHLVSRAFALGLSVRYLSSLPNAGVVEEHVGGTTRPMDLRSHRLAVALAPRVQLDDAGSWELGAAIGYASRNIRPEVHHLITPSYSLAGPNLQLHLRVTLVEGLLGLRLGPELHWLASVGGELTDRGVGDSGFAVGGEVGLELSFGERFAALLGYRELHAQLDAGGGDEFRDVMRFMSARLEATW